VFAEDEFDDENDVRLRNVSISKTRARVSLVSLVSRRIASYRVVASDDCSVSH